MYLRAVFKWQSKVITWLRLLRLVIGLRDSRQFFNQWEAKPKPIAPCTRDFSRALSELQVITRNCDWFIVLLLLWLVGVIAFVLVFRQSFENRSIIKCITLYLYYRRACGRARRRGSWRACCRASFADPIPYIHWVLLPVFAIQPGSRKKELGISWGRMKYDTKKQ